MINRTWILIMIMVGGGTGLTLMSGCSKSEPPQVRTTNATAPEGFDVARLDGYRVKELLIVLFARDYAPSDWMRIFDLTKALSVNKKKLRSIEGVMSESADPLRGDLIAANAELLTTLGESSLFIMSWSVTDENCRFVSEASTRLVCKPRNLDNPLNGGLPSPDGAVEWVQPNPVTSDLKQPYLRLTLRSDLDPAFRIELRLKPELLSEQESWFKGEAVPTPESLFVNESGETQSPGFPYGYAEMTISR